MKKSISFDKNNIDFFRLILASIVACFHICVLAEIAAFSPYIKYFSADFAVKAFYVISGMLVYRSYTRSSSVRSYFEKRARRIYPAYFTVIVVAALSLSMLSTVPLSRYFGLGFWKYLAANLVFLNHLAPSLPGVFQSNSETAVDGALWTLKIEVLFYLFVPVLHFLIRKLGPKISLIGLYLFSCTWRYSLEYLADKHVRIAGIPIYSKLYEQFPGQLIYFIAGVLLLIYFDQLKSKMAWVALATICLYALDHFVTAGALDAFWIAGTVFVFCYWRYLGNFSKYGDFSYGVYIVHWPILQTLIFFGLNKQNPAIFLAVSLPAIAIAAILLWHLVEKRFLARSSHYRLVSAQDVAKTPASKVLT
jgi:peptidoglycan/LPS O-acetylase OafA/YrhL